MKKMIPFASVFLTSLFLTACSPAPSPNRADPPEPRSSDRGIVHDIATDTAEATGKAVVATQEAASDLSQKTERMSDKAAVHADEAKSDYQDLKQDVKESYRDGKREQEQKR